MNPADRLERAENRLRITSAEIRVLMDRLEDETKLYNAAIEEAAEALVKKVESCNEGDMSKVLWLQQVATWLDDDFTINYINPGWDDPPIKAADGYRFCESME